MSDKTTTILATSGSTDTGSTSSGDMPSFSNTVFEFLDENYPLSGNSSGDFFEEREWNEDDQEEDVGSSEGKKAFWDEQEKLLQGILCRTSSIESKIRTATKEALRQLDSTTQCGCPRPVGAFRCCDCLRREAFKHLTNAGFNCSIRKSKWRSSPEIPSGEHTYLEVLEKPSRNKGQIIRVVIELNFRGEFEMARASQDYDRLVKRLPELYVGKAERLKNLIKVMCGAAKKCMKEKKMHLGPWRKHKYMQAKWLGPSTEVVVRLVTTTTMANTPLVAGCSDRQIKPRASMLTLSLLDKLPVPCQAVAVI